MRLSTRSKAWFTRAVEAAGPRDHGPDSNPATGVMAGLPSIIFIADEFLSRRHLDPVQTTAGVLLAALCTLLILVPAGRATPLVRLAALAAGCSSIVMLDLGSGNAGVTGQLYFCLPVLFAAVHLRVPGVIAVTTTALICESVVVGTLLPPLSAVLDLAFVGSIFTLMAFGLARAGEAHTRLTERLRRQAAVDPLTGLVTRRVLDEATQQAVTQIDADAGTALVLIDVDLFKEINDTYGHAVGDDALAHISATLASRCRGADVVARLGGDELAVLMPGCTYEVATKRAEEFTQAVRDTPLVLHDRRVIALSISAGASHAPTLAHTARELYTTADVALYAVKRTRPGH